MMKRHKYKSYTDFALSATTAEKKRFIKMIIEEANKLQSESVGIK